MSNRGRMAVLVGGQYGSEGKGAVAAHLAYRYDVHVRVGSPNAGHTIWWNGERHVMQTIPCGWINPDARIVIGRGALVSPRLLMQELAHIETYYPDFRDRLYIDPMAGVLDERFHEAEGGVDGDIHRRIGSTGEGVGAARIARLRRDPSEFRMFGEIAGDLGLETSLCYNTPDFLARMQDSGLDVMLEGTQGSALSLYHSYWPYCTTVDTNAAGIIAEVGVAPSRVTDVVMVCRTYPIRVAGNSGPMRNETDWDRVSRAAGREVEERTTVTRKVRRVAEWDDELFRQACLLNSPTEIALTFCDYVDPMLHGADSLEQVAGSKLLRDFMTEHRLWGRVKYFGTGPDAMVEVM